MSGDAKDSKDQEVMLTLLACFLAICATCYGIYSRTLDDFIHYGTIITVALWTLYGIGLVVTVVVMRPFPGVGFVLAMVAMLAIVVPLVSAVVYSVAVSLKDTFVALFDLGAAFTWRGAAVVALATALTLGLGTALFFFRLYCRAWYGLSETIVGVIVSVVKVTGDTHATPTNPEFLVAILTASVYLVVRGLDNVREGLTVDAQGHAKDPSALRAWTWLQRKYQESQESSSHGGGDAGGGPAAAPRL